MKKSFTKTLIVQLSAFLIFGAVSVFSQTTEFSYRVFLTNTNASANGNYDFEFKIYNEHTGENLQINS